MAEDTSVSDEDLERAAQDYVDPRAVRRGEVRGALSDAGFDGNSLDAFESGILNSDEVAASVDRGDRILTREDVQRTAESIDKRTGGRDEAIVDEAARELGAPSEASLSRARASVAQRVDEEGMVRSDPSLDPLGGSDGREIGTVSEITEATGGRGGGMREVVEKTGSDTATLYYEDSGGDRYPVAEVDL